MFSILPEFKEQYSRYIDLGKKYLSNQKIIVVGLTRNSESYLEENILAIDNIKSYCSKLSYFIYENDSTDNTSKTLSSLKSKVQNFDYRSDKLNLKQFVHGKNMDLKSIERTSNLAKHRNICLSHVQKNNDKFDFVIVMDTDFQKFSLDGIINSFGWLSANYCDAMVGNSFEMKSLTMDQTSQIIWNYDCWAYRGSWWEDLQKYAAVYSHDPMMWFGFWQPPIGSSPIKVNSAFGGIAIYKSADYIKSKYDGYDCEHVCFHKNMITKFPDYKICINPSQMMFF